MKFTNIFNESIEYASLANKEDTFGGIKEKSMDCFISSTNNKKEE